ncbi:MAG: hypothetical protein V3S04_03945, partial [Candidatus Omnitrophota bacterium]
LMEMKVYCKIIRPLMLAAVISILCSQSLYGAGLDDLYKPLLKKRRFLYDGHISSFLKKEKGVHGRATFGKFDASPFFFKSKNLIQFAPFDFLNIGLIGDETFPAKYERTTHNLDGSVGTRQEYRLNYFRTYGLMLRARVEPVEFYFEYLRNWQKSRTTSMPGPNPMNFFTYTKAGFEDAKGEIRYVSPGNSEEDRSNLSKIKRPLLNKNQLSLESGLRYRRGSLEMKTDFMVLPTGNFNIRHFHRLRAHFEPYVVLKLGLLDNLEMESGLAYTTPLQYKYEYKQFNPAGTSLLITGKYRWKDNFYIPLKLRYRIKKNTELKASSDIRVINQKLEHWQKDATNVLTSFAHRELMYYNIQPTASLTYLYDADKEVSEDEFQLLTKTLLLKDQWMFECLYKRDITRLDKRAGNGPLNIIDPYNVYQYPLDFFVAGTEHAAFLTGNISATAASVMPQNYHLIKLGLTYGLMDHLNLGVTAGYRMTSALEHFTLSDARRRSFKFKQYCFFDILCDWRLTKNTLLSFQGHIVPKYLTLLTREGDVREYKSEDSYFDLMLSLKAFF